MASHGDINTPPNSPRIHACETEGILEERKKLWEQGRTMAGAGSGKKGSFVTRCGWTSPEEKLVLVRWAVFGPGHLLLYRPWKGSL